MKRRRAATMRRRFLALVGVLAALGAQKGAIADPAASAARATSPPALAPSPATAADPLESPECRHALAELSARESAVAETTRASGGVTANDPRLIDAALAPARRQAARLCLARSADRAASSASPAIARPPPIATAPLAVAPPIAASTAPPARTAPPSPPVLARPAERPYAITSCDAGGCWANDGSRLNRVGPMLWGPRGACTVQGSLVQCP